jgi:CRISPR-associated protein Csm5
MADYTIYDVTVSTLTPLHIGSGIDLLHEYDYAIYNGRTWRINEYALLDAQNVDDPALADQLARTPPTQLLQTGDYRDGSPFFRYVIAGTPRSNAEGAQVREQIKDVYDRPYLPGSSLKGALRTALGWHIWGERRLRPDASRLQRKRQWAASAYEKALFGRDPNHDVLRAIQVSDSEPLSASQLMIANVRVQDRGGGLKAPIEAEAVRPDVAFNGTIKIDRALFSDWAKRAELPAEGAEWLGNLPRIMQAHTAARVRGDLAWFRAISANTKIVQFYQQLDRARLGPNRFLVQLGWGAGWESKTFGVRLRSDRGFMERIVHDYRLARGRRREGDPFPKTRRVAVSFQRSPDGRIREQPAPPLGWCLVEMKERKE